MPLHTNHGCLYTQCTPFITVLLAQICCNERCDISVMKFFCFNISRTTATQSCGALSILCIASKSSSTVLSSNLQDIIDIGFGRLGKNRTVACQDCLHCSSEII